MTAPRPLPDSPDLDQLKRQAKDLLRAARAADPAALSRFRTLPSLAARERRRPRSRLGRAPRRAVGHRARARLPILERAARARRGADARLRLGRARVHRGGDRRALGARRATARAVPAASPARRFYTALLAGRRRDGRVAPRAAAGARARARRAARLGAAPLRLSHLARPSTGASADGLVAIARRLLAARRRPRTRAFPGCITA